MAKNNKKQGTRYELKSQAWLEKWGFTCSRSASSMSPWDIVAVCPTHTYLIQVKSGRLPRPSETKQFVELPVNEATIKLVWHWRKGARVPNVLYSSLRD